MRPVAISRLLLLAILQGDRQLYGVERLFDSQQFENFELAVSAKGGHSYITKAGKIVCRKSAISLQFFTQLLYLNMRYQPLFHRQIIHISLQIKIQ